MNDEVFRLLAAQKRDRDQRFPDMPFVFYTPKGEPIEDFRRAWATACEKAKIPGRLFHDFRRTGVRNMIRAGVPDVVAMAISGHKTRSVFDRYNIVNVDDRKLATQKTEAYIKAMEEANPFKELEEMGRKAQEEPVSIGDRESKAKDGRDPA
jgi:integrase